jgi:hypothetical protein|tara:strand:- start:322 stop:624 length:303 start_codon:yes stop_codon:yes gene_type:complete
MSEEDFNHYSSSLNRQVGGDHYKDCVIQPTVYCQLNKLNTCEANIVKYITRHNKKGEGKKDIEKVIHYAEMLLELEYPDKDAQQELFNDLIERGRHVQIK